MSLFIIALSLLLRFIGTGSNDLLAEEAYYWNYAQHPDFSYLDHPPMVALLIKASTWVFGISEFSVRLPSILCWMAAAFFSFKLTELLARGAGVFAVMFLAILPFFFVQSLVITPDQPLIVCWSAALYYLYRALIKGEAHCWYVAGMWVGLGMLSKYTIVLLGPISLVYLCVVPEARQWLTRKEPYLGALIALLIFTPVIGWNASHNWVSFVFQGSARFHAATHFTLHYVIGLLFLFLMPLGMYSLWKLVRTKKPDIIRLDTPVLRFLQLFTLLPLLFFGYFSLRHTVKFNWIGPGLLAFIPWMAFSLYKESKTLRVVWLVSALAFLPVYGAIIYCINFGRPEQAHKTFLTKFIAWKDLTGQLYDMAQKTEQQTHIKPTFVALDLYETASELAFYQAKSKAEGKIDTVYPVTGRHLFGWGSLMYKYWDNKTSPANNLLILIARDPDFINSPRVTSRVIAKSAVQTIWSKSQRAGIPVRPVYVQVVELRSATE